MQSRGGRWLADQQHGLVEANDVRIPDEAVDTPMPPATAKLIECLSVKSLEAVSDWSDMAVCELVARAGVAHA